MSRLDEQIKQAVAAFTGCKTTPALIGGLALAAHQVVRATRDVDFLADADDANRLHEILLALGQERGRVHLQPFELSRGGRCVRK